MKIHVCGPAVEEVSRKDWRERWCFACRKRHMFILIVMAPVEMSYYGPHREIRCSACNGIDSDVFPGIERYWDDGDD